MEDNEVTADLRGVRLESWGGGLVACGQVFGDRKGRFPDGTPIRTTYLKAIDGNLITTRNSVYRVL